MPDNNCGKWQFENFNHATHSTLCIHVMRSTFFRKNENACHKFNVIDAHCTCMCSMACTRAHSSPLTHYSTFPRDPSERFDPFEPNYEGKISMEKIRFIELNSVSTNSHFQLMAPQIKSVKGFVFCCCGIFWFCLYCGVAYYLV